MARHNKTGKWGEEIACDLLTAQGFAIAERNWREGHLEIDLIAMDANLVVFVEVKTRSDASEDPFETIDRRKIINIVNAAKAYMAMHPTLHQGVRFDLIGISGTPEHYEVEHLSDAFDPPVKTY